MFYLRRKWDFQNAKQLKFFSWFTRMKRFVSKLTLGSALKYWIIFGVNFVFCYCAMIHSNCRTVSDSASKNYLFLNVYTYFIPVWCHYKWIYLYLVKIEVWYLSDLMTLCVLSALHYELFWINCGFVFSTENLHYLQVMFDSIVLMIIYTLNCSSCTCACFNYCHDCAIGAMIAYIVQSLVYVMIAICILMSLDSCATKEQC